jgi:hypothetical protein
LWAHQWTFTFRKKWRIAWVDERLLASQEGLGSYFLSLDIKIYL